MSWVEDLKEKYSYCSNIEFIPFPSASPQYFIGYALWCKKHEEELDDEKCLGCKDKCQK